jgi:hypothetical protein
MAHTAARPKEKAVGVGECVLVPLLAVADLQGEMDFPPRRRCDRILSVNLIFVTSSLRLTCTFVCVAASGSLYEFCKKSP